MSAGLLVRQSLILKTVSNNSQLSWILHAIIIAG